MTDEPKNMLRIVTIASGVCNFEVHNFNFNTFVTTLRANGGYMGDTCYIPHHAIAMVVWFPPEGKPQGIDFGPTMGSA